MKKIEREFLLKLCRTKLIDQLERLEKTLSRTVQYENCKHKGETEFTESYIHTSSFFRTKAKQDLIEIKRALLKIKNGEFGICEITNEEISWNRLLAVPWARYSKDALESISEVG